MANHTDANDPWGRSTDPSPISNTCTFRELAPLRKFQSLPD
jgi:hypothetical protein